MISCLEGRSVAIFRPAALEGSLEAQFGISNDGHRPVDGAPPVGKHGVFSRSTKAFNEHQGMVDEQLVHPVAQANRQHVLTVSGSQRGRHLTKHVRGLFQPEMAHFGSNHVAHGNHRHAGFSENGSKFTFA